MKLSKKIATFLVSILLCLPSIGLSAVVKPVFYSLSPYGAGSGYDLMNGSPTISISGGVATLSVAQTGNIGIGCDIDYGAGPTHVYIAPNRIPFNSGGTTELKTGDKIEGGTSGATGIIRAIELTSGTWAGGDAAGYIYFSTSSGTWQSEQINRIKPSSSSDIASCTGAIQGNLGNGDTQFVVKDPDGDDAANDSGSINYIYHEYASLALFESGFTDGTHINNADLTAAQVVVHACCYYDHNDYDPDTGNPNFFWSGTTSATYYVNVFTPTGDSESINNQRHSGIKNTNKFLLTASSGNLIVLREDYTRVEGIQMDKSDTSFGMCMYLKENGLRVTDCILYNTGSGGAYGISWEPPAGTSTVYVVNNLLYDFDDDAMNSYVGTGNTLNVYCYNNTFHNCTTGIDTGGGAGTRNYYLKNNIVNDCTDDFSGTFDATSTHNVTDTAGAEGAWGATHSTGTTTGAAANKLIDTGATFQTDGVQINSIITNTTDTTYTYVTAVDSETQLTIANDIFATSENYSVYTNMYGAVTFENEGADNFHLGSGDTVAKDKGKDLSTDASFPLWDDIEADERSASWDVGMDEFIAAVGPSIPIIMYHYIHH